MISEGVSQHNIVLLHLQPHSAQAYLIVLQKLCFMKKSTAGVFGFTYPGKLFPRAHFSGKGPKHKEKDAISNLFLHTAALCGHILRGRKERPEGKKTCRRWNKTKFQDFGPVNQVIKEAQFQYTTNSFSRLR